MARVEKNLGLDKDDEEFVKKVNKVDGFVKEPEEDDGWS